MDEATRAWAYRIAVGLIAALIVWDVATGGDAGEWARWIVGGVGLGAAGLAARNTRVRKR